MTRLLKDWLDHFSPGAQAAIIAAVVGLISDATDFTETDK
jgi:hypothetical protein